MYLPTQVANCRPPPMIGMEKKSLLPYLSLWNQDWGSSHTDKKKAPALDLHGSLIGIRLQQQCLGSHCSSNNAH
ncbi:hypothetical protein TNCV_4062721 [Trichonephila clavipes]|nr:hypothetical protein TNCV_4062721 [Trichonephila clavipes]